MYQEAMDMDPADPVPVRFLAELHRHHTGQWDLARTLFHKVLSMPADDISRAVALHGLGKMTIHDGEFQKGVGLMERSLEVYPLALTCRNLAVYWNSERNPEKAHAYVQRALAIDPDDDYNQIFAATYLVELGRPDEAREVARKHADVMAASYNLAVIEAQLGNRTKALELLRRHFYAYEQFDAVRSKEMQEARDDLAFRSLHADPEFVKLTAPAENDASSYHRRPS
jgi:tetratricopeptide (TPR) repeat protein